MEEYAYLLAAKNDTQLMYIYDDVNRMIELYRDGRYTQAEELKNSLAERLDDIMRLSRKQPFINTK
jgi:hypothetical protein